MKTLSFFSSTGWLEDPEYPHAQWQVEVASDETLMGYMRWVMARHDEDSNEYVPDPDVALENEEPPTTENQIAFSREHWKAGAAALDTRLSYWNWVAHQVAAEN